MNKPIDGARGNSIAGGNNKEGELSYFHSCMPLFISLFQDSVKLQINSFVSLSLNSKKNNIQSAEEVYVISIFRFLFCANIILFSQGRLAGLLYCFRHLTVLVL